MQTFLGVFETIWNHLSDGFFLIIVVLCIIAGFKRGLYKTLSGTVTLFFDILVSFAAQKIISTFVAQKAVNVILDAVSGDALLGFSMSDDTSRQISNVIVKPLQDSIIGSMIFIIAFLLVLVIWLYLCTYFNLQARFPAEPPIGKFFAILIGAVKGVILALVLFYILYKIGMVSKDTITNSIILGHSLAYFIS